MGFYINSNMHMNFSVLMSVYIRETAEFLDKALESVLINQTVKPAELILVADGLLTT
jgi:glycosyltransferase involved in cell wall biosynthesis